jgi:hypothetical protein
METSSDMGVLANATLSNLFLPISAELCRYGTAETALTLLG